MNREIDPTQVHYPLMPWAQERLATPHEFSELMRRDLGEIQEPPSAWDDSQETPDDRFEGLLLSQLGALAARERRLVICSDDPIATQASLMHAVFSRAAVWDSRARELEARHEIPATRLVVSATLEPGLTPLLTDPEFMSIFSEHFRVINTTPSGLMAGLDPQQAAMVYSTAAARDNHEAGLAFNAVMEPLCTALGEWTSGQDGRRTFLPPTADILREALYRLQGARTSLRYNDLRLLNDSQIDIVDRLFSDQVRAARQSSIDHLAGYFMVLAPRMFDAHGNLVGQIRPTLPPNTARHGKPITTVLCASPPGANLDLDVQFDLLVRVLNLIETKATRWGAADALALTGIDLVNPPVAARLIRQAINRRTPLILGLHDIPQELRSLVAGSGFCIGNINPEQAAQLIPVLPKHWGELLTGSTRTKTSGVSAVTSQQQGLTFSDVGENGGNSGSGSGVDTHDEFTQADTVKVGAIPIYLETELTEIPIDHAVMLPSGPTPSGPTGIYELLDGHCVGDFPAPRQAALRVAASLGRLSRQTASRVKKILGAQNSQRQLPAAANPPDPHHQAQALPSQPGRPDGIPGPLRTEWAVLQDTYIRFAYWRDTRPRGAAKSWEAYVEALYNKRGAMDQDVTRKDWRKRYPPPPDY